MNEKVLSSSKNMKTDNGKGLESPAAEKEEAEMVYTRKGRKNIRAQE